MIIKYNNYLLLRKYRTWNGRSEYVFTNKKYISHLYLIVNAYSNRVEVCFHCDKDIAYIACYETSKNIEITSIKKNIIILHEDNIVQIKPFDVILDHEKYKSFLKEINSIYLKLFKKNDNQV